MTITFPDDGGVFSGYQARYVVEVEDPDGEVDCSNLQMMTALETPDSAGGGQNLGYIEVDDWWAYEPMSLYNVERSACASRSGGTVRCAGTRPTVRRSAG